MFVFFFKQKTAYEMRISDWSSDVCSSDLAFQVSSVIARYDALVAAGELRPGPDQRAAAVRRDGLQQELEASPPRGSTLWKLLRKAPEPPRGLYMWGGVGRGKSMLMDLFFDAVHIQRKKRAHFHEFMLDVHARLAEARKSETGDPIPPVVDSLAEEARLLCFDERSDERRVGEECDRTCRSRWSRYHSK